MLEHSFGVVFPRFCFLAPTAQASARIHNKYRKMCDDLSLEQDFMCLVRSFCDGTVSDESPPVSLKDDLEKGRPPPHLVHQHLHQGGGGGGGHHIHDGGGGLFQDHGLAHHHMTHVSGIQSGKIMGRGLFEAGFP
jgi:hypothetical protein